MKKLLILTSFLIIYTTTFSQEKGLLYEIKGNGNANPSYIFGTFHLLCKEDFEISEKLISVFNKSNKIALEIDMDDPKIAFKMMANMNMKNDSVLSDLLAEPEYQYLNTFVKDTLKMSMTLIMKMKPFMLFSLIMPKMLDCQIMSYEQEFMKMAQKKEIVGLETLEDQMAIFDQIPYKQQAKELYKTIKEMDKTKREFNDLVTSYKSKNLSKLNELVAKSEDFYSGFEKVLLENRNKNWIPVIENLTKNQSTFIAVGAGHLGGEMGVLELLKQKGFTVTVLE